MNPSPLTCGGNTLIIPMGVQGQRQVETRQGLLVYASAPMPAPLEVAGGSGANSQREQTFLLCRAEFRPEAPRSRLQVQFDLERREVAV
jgi:hypothetical protein